MVRREQNEEKCEEATLTVRFATILVVVALGTSVSRGAVEAKLFFSVPLDDPKRVRLVCRQAGVLRARQVEDFPSDAGGTAIASSREEHSRRALTIVAVTRALALVCRHPVIALLVPHRAALREVNDLRSAERLLGDGGRDPESGEAGD